MNINVSYWTLIWGKKQELNISPTCSWFSWGRCWPAPWFGWKVGEPQVFSSQQTPPPMLASAPGWVSVHHFLGWLLLHCLQLCPLEMAWTCLVELQIKAKSTYLQQHHLDRELIQGVRGAIKYFFGKSWAFGPTNGPPTRRRKLSRQKKFYVYFVF